jgi:hypothetical protein
VSFLKGEERIMRITRVLFVFVALTAMLLFSACGGSEPAPAVQESTAAAEPAPVATAALPATAPEPVPAESAPAPLWPEPFPADPAAAAPEAVRPASSRDFRAETAQYIGYFKSIYLTPEQEAIKKAALSKIPAPCCSENSIATCCCPCNMAKAVWGLSAYLITEKDYDAPRLEKAVRDWLAAANPNGFSGKACYTGGCARSIQHDGCAGMVEEVVL